MTGTILSHNKRLIFSLLLLFGFSSTVMSFQKNLTGNINQPKSHVVSIPNPYPVSDRVIVDDATGFSVNDTILIIQMQGVGILTAPFGSYGTLQEIFGEPGMHEFLIITAVNANEIVFSSYLLKDYDPNGNIQIVRVPYYNSATVAGTLFCDSWNPATGSGGVLAMIIGRTLKLDADIDVSGRGLVGGITSIGDGICYYTNTTLYGEEYYDQNFPNAGFKGEGLAIHDNTGTLLSPNFVKGFGPNFTGGGGGNGRYSGGGGGSNRGEGGLGGKEDGSLCSTFPLPGGKGGFKADYTSLINRIYMGGGGGASTDSLTGSSSYGGNGGGIVIIVADTIIGNGGNILSNGGNGGSATGVAGSGGGGAAGSIALSLNSYGSTPLNFSLS
ncbi:MAG: hypothetical protein NTV31_08920 [Bacteroidia bacterium]|nr:hypothetical protein [Bacteroidia bacterium]